jgi:hypothetical protein
LLCFGGTLADFSRDLTSRAACETENIEIGDYRIASCNVGATEVWTGDIVPYQWQPSFGCFFQRGNNNCFSSNAADNASIIMGGNQVDLSEWTIPSTYSSGVWIAVTPRESSNNMNLRGGSGDTATGAWNGGTNYRERQ